jgi:hypothetical protein
MRLLLLAACAAALTSVEPARVVVGTEVLRPADLVPPLGVNSFGGMGSNNWAANNLIPNPGNEPVVWRNFHRVRSVADNGLITIDGGGVSWYQLWASGFLSGASVRIYRLADAQGQPLPVVNNDIDANQAARLIKVGETRVAPEGSAGLPDGGWLVESYGPVHPTSSIDGRNVTATDATVINGRTYWYTLVTTSADGTESELASEVSVTPQAKAGANLDPAILMPAEDKLPDMWPNSDWSYQLKALGGTSPLTWSLASGSLPAGFTMDPATGVVSGKVPAQRPGEVVVRFRVTDANKRSDERTLVAHPVRIQASDAAGKPQPATGLTAIARDGAVTVSWKPAPGANAVRYGLRRSTKPKAEQRDGILLAAGAPAVRLGDYLAIERSYTGFPDMRYVNGRVRGIGNPPDQAGCAWYVDNLAANRINHVPHPQPIPADMADPGQTCLYIEVAPGAQKIWRPRFISGDKGQESQWYGYMEVGKAYHVEFWMRQEGLANDGKITFNLNGQLNQVNTSWNVDGTWKKYTYSFVAPEPPASCWHYGPALHYTGPGKLWIDNGRMSRIDRPEDAQKPYVFDRLAFDELVMSQPETGRKGSHRIWFLNKDATMEGITSWHANSTWSPDWITGVSDTLDMTLPMGLEFDLATGATPETRMRPWLVLQHLTHSEDEWRGLVEYLAAPYDPAKDTPKAKPWAHKRFMQRGHGRPWTAEFPSIAIQFGNETWHNGQNAEWLGFAWRGNIFQGGRAYGLAMQYLCNEIRKSPYWASEKLDGKLKFVVDGGYIENAPNDDGTLKPNGYGGQAMQASATPHWLSQANYVGPKWETGDKASEVWSDSGIQENLLGWVTGTQNAEECSATWKLLASKGRAYELTAYEGGPSGFALPGQGSPEVIETNERYGKSLAIAIASMDCWLGSYQLGWTEQCYFNYGMGMRWNSHTVMHGGIRPAPGWQAMTIRNRHARGDLVKADVVSTLVITRGARSFPLVGAYAMRDGKRWSLFLLSRSLNDTIPTTIQMPFQTAARISLHQLVGDPRATNRTKLEVEIKDSEVPAQAFAKGVLTVDGGLQPGSFRLYVFEDAR